MKYAFVGAHSKEFSIKRMCQVLEVNRSGYYDWRLRKECARSGRDRVLLKEIRKVHQDTKEAYGAIKTWRVLKDAGLAYGKHRVARLRRLAAIEARRKRRFRVASGSRHSAPPAKNRMAHYVPNSSDPGIVLKPPRLIVVESDLYL